MIALLLSTALAAIIITRLESWERRWIWLAFVAHIAAAVAQVVVTTHYFGGGDMFLYLGTGRELQSLVALDFATWAGPVLQIAAGGEAYLPIHVVGQGSSTGAMSGLVAWCLLLGGGSLYGVCFYFATFAFVGQCAMYRVFREIFPPAYRRRTLLAVFFVPSVVFWSSGALKEAIALGGLGICMLGVWRLLFTRHPLRGAVLTVLGVFALSLSKAYVLGPLALAVAVWFYWSRRAGSWTPTAFMRNTILVLVASLAAGYGMVYLGELYPQYAVANISAETAYLQGLYYQNEAAGSTYQFGEATQEAQLSYAPLALLSSLARPFIFEVHNVVSLIAAIEMSALLVMIALVVRKHRVRPLLKRAIRSPVIVFLAVFVCLFGLGVGLGAPNIGSLSRYRILMMPFYVLMIVAFLPHRSPG